jgi:hypothetical protein
MVQRLRISLAGMVVSVTVFGYNTDAWAQQRQSESHVVLPRFGVVAGLSLRQITADAGADRTWSGAGFSVAVDGNVSDHLAITTSVEKDAQPGDILLSRSRGVGLRWEVGYDVVSGDEHQAYGRAAIGVVFGPRLSSRP